MSPRELVLRLVAWLRRDRLSRELAAELEAHTDLLARDLERDGMAPADARATARRQLGNATVIREASRDAWGFPTLDALLQDLRYAVRGLVQARGFAITVILTLGLGIGANTAMFAVLDRLMFRPFPHMRDPASVHQVFLQFTGLERRVTTATMPYARFLDLQRSTSAFSQVTPISEWRVAVGTGQNTRVRKVAGVGAGFFGLFDAPPVRGRYFGPVDDSPPMGALVAVLSYGHWQSEFGGRDVIGTSLRVAAFDYTIIGVAPEGFVGTVQGRPPEIFIPITTVPANLDASNRDTYDTAYNWDWVQVLVRRRPEVTEAMATADLTTAYQRSRAIQRGTNPRVRPDSLAHPVALAGPLRSAAGPDAGLESRVLLWVSGVAAIVLLIACANVANLMLVRVLRRRREIAVRLALGVRRGRLVRQFFVEALLLALLGIGMGIVFAQLGGAAIRQLLLPEGSTYNLATDWRTLGVATICAFAAALLTSIGPAVLAARSELTTELKAGARSGTYRRSTVRSAMLVTQGALSVVLLVGAGLFVRSFANVLAIPLGYDASRVAQVYADFRGMEFDSTELVAVRRRLLEAAESLPGVAAAARVNSRLFGTNTTSLRVPGVDSVEALGRFNFQIVSAGYFSVMRTRIIDGRAFSEVDGRSAPPVAVVSSSMARALWPGRSALGQCLQAVWNSLSPRTNPSAVPCTTVIGIAEDVAQQGITDEQRFMYYVNVEQVDPAMAARMYVRLSGPLTARAMEQVRIGMQAAMPGDGFVVVESLQEAVDDQRRSWRLGATLFVAFGGLALAVAAVGFYGVIAYTVAQRMQEVATRMVFGARAGHIARLVVGQGVGFAVAAVVIGLLVAAVASRWIEPLLYKQSPRDPVVFAAVCAVMIVVGIVASAVPAVRAVRADPNRALRAE